ncbi:MAG: FkbM family methyltransferase [Terriglobales bacterium]
MVRRSRMLAPALARLPSGVQFELRRFNFYREIRSGRFLPHEPEIAVVAQYLHDGDWAVDVGANVGHYTCYMSGRVGASGRVLAFEPIPTSFALLAANVRATGARNVTLFNLALSSASSIAGMTIPHYENSHLSNYYQANICAGGDYPVLCLALDSIPVLGHVRLVKIDAEGHDLQVLQGMEALLSRNRPVLIVEGSLSGAVADWLNEREYVLRKMPARRTLSPSRGSDRETDHARRMQRQSEETASPAGTGTERDRIEILFIIDYFHRTGGTEKHLVQLVTGLPQEEFRCSLVVFDLGANPLLDQLRARNVPIISLPVRREYVPNALLQGWRLWRLIRIHKYDVVQTIHQKADSYGALIARLAGARHLISSKRDTGALRRPWHFLINRCLKRLFQMHIVVADAVGAAVVANDRLPPEQIVTIYNGVDADRFRAPDSEQRSEARLRLGFSAGHFVVGMVAAFRPEKNHEVFFAALQGVAAQIPSLKVLAVGAGPQLARFRKEIEVSSLRTRTVFAGDVGDVVPYLWAMDVGCLTPGSNEGFSNAVLEQMAVGLPVVVTAVGGNAEAIVDGESGRVIPPSDTAALARAIMDLHDDPAHRRALGSAARRRVEEQFSLARMCSEHARLYRCVISAQRAPRRAGVTRE